MALNCMFQSVFAALVILQFSWDHVETRVPISFINQWFKVACLPSQLKLADNYICDRYGNILCLPGWSAPENFCSTPVCDPGCVKHQGNCTGPDTCTCEIGWRGYDCSQCVCLPGCLNGGCEKPFECKCDEGWEGLYCDKPICNSNCTHGTCTLPGGCDCHPGWEGEDCDLCLELPGCTHGSCSKPLECNCEEGYEGAYCDKAICTQGCSPVFGKCHEPGTCVCVPGMEGPTCETCIAHPQCQNGDCRDGPFQCICEEGFTGYLCDIPLSPSAPARPAAPAPAFPPSAPRPQPAPDRFNIGVRPIATTTEPNNDIFVQNFGSLNSNNRDQRFFPRGSQG